MNKSMMSVLSIAAISMFSGVGIIIKEQVFHRPLTGTQSYIIGITLIAYSILLLLGCFKKSKK